MPEPVPPQTSKQAKRAYQKNKVFRFTASQERAAARRSAKDAHARKLREKEERSKVNKRKRDEKEQKEREAKRQLVEKGQLPKDALLPKVPASQPRLNLFVRQAQKPILAGVSAVQQRDEDDETVKGDSDDEEDTLVDKNRPTVLPPKMDDEELGEIFSTPPSDKQDMMAREAAVTEEVVPQPSVVNDPPYAQEQIRDSSKDSLEAQLGCPLSHAVTEIKIFEDPLPESEQATIVTTSPRKRKRGLDEFATPTRSGRSALSEMSPAKVLLRSQERPDTTSAPSIAARMLSPIQQGPSSTQLVEETLAMISTQDFADDYYISPSKENTDPGRAISSQRQAGCSQVRSAGEPMTELKKSVAAKVLRADEYDCDDSFFDELVDKEEADDYSDDITEADWASLSTQPPKNTAVSWLGSPKKAKAAPSKSPEKSMAPPPRPSPVMQLITKLKEVTPQKRRILAIVPQEEPTASQSFDFDDGISDADLAALSSQVSSNMATKVVPRPSSSVHFDQIHRVVPHKEVRSRASPTQQELPPASQSFGMNDGMDEDMMALVEEIDLVSSSATTRAKKCRTLPWQDRPSN